PARRCRERHWQECLCHQSVIPCHLSSPASAREEVALGSGWCLWARARNSWRRNRRYLRAGSHVFGDAARIGGAVLNIDERRRRDRDSFRRGIGRRRASGNIAYRVVASVRLIPVVPATGRGAPVVVAAEAGVPAPRRPVEMVFAFVRPALIELGAVLEVVVG